MLSADPSPARRVARRQVLVDGGRALLAVAALGAAVQACGSPPPPAPRTLTDQLDMARRDSELATAAAEAAPPPIAPALREVAAERARHASALVEEIARAAGTPIPSESTTTLGARREAVGIETPRPLSPMCPRPSENRQNPRPGWHPPCPGIGQGSSIDRGRVHSVLPGWASPERGRNDISSAGPNTLCGARSESSRQAGSRRFIRRRGHRACHHLRLWDRLGALSPEANDLVSEALAQHRERREAALKLLAQASVKHPSLQRDINFPSRSRPPPTQPIWPSEWKPTARSPGAP